MSRWGSEALAVKAPVHRCGVTVFVSRLDHLDHLASPSSCDALSIIIQFGVLDKRVVVTSSRCSGADDVRVSTPGSSRAQVQGQRSQDKNGLVRHLLPMVESMDLPMI